MSGDGVTVQLINKRWHLGTFVKVCFCRLPVQNKAVWVVWSSFLRLSFFSWSQILPNCMSWESKLQNFSPYLDIALHAFQETVYAYKLILLLPLPLQENKSICQGIFSAESDLVPAHISDCDVPVATESVLGWENKVILTIRPKSKSGKTQIWTPEPQVPFLHCRDRCGLGQRLHTI